MDEMGENQIEKTKGRERAERNKKPEAKRKGKKLAMYLLGPMLAASVAVGCGDDDTTTPEGSGSRSDAGSDVSDVNETGTWELNSNNEGCTVTEQSCITTDKTVEMSEGSESNLGDVKFILYEYETNGGYTDAKFVITDVCGGTLHQEGIVVNQSEDGRVFHTDMIGDSYYTIEVVGFNDENGTFIIKLSESCYPPQDDGNCVVTERSCNQGESEGITLDGIGSSETVRGIQYTLLGFEIGDDGRIRAMVEPTDSCGNVLEGYEDPIKIGEGEEVEVPYGNSTYTMRVTDLNYTTNTVEFEVSERCSN